ncbi:MAG: hypothetical protein QOH14_2824 [Pseudonocardiales bacterium]|nr:hypothetical protein [Pseudonocardiales bacterium]
MDRDPVEMRCEMFAQFLMRSVVVTAAAGLTLAGAVAAAAAAATSLQVSPTSAPAGSVVHVSGTCEANTTGVAISSGFLHDATHDFAGVGAASFTTDSAGRFATDAQIPASTTPGSYPVTARCGGGNLGVSATLVVTPAGAPTAVPAGSGGHAAAVTSATGDARVLLAGIGALLLLVGAAGVVRQRRPVRR